MQRAEVLVAQEVKFSTGLYEAIVPLQYHKLYTDAVAKDSVKPAEDKANEEDEAEEEDEAAEEDDAEIDEEDVDEEDDDEANEADEAVKHTSLTPVVNHLTVG